MGELSAKQLEAIRLLTLGASQVMVAQHLGVDTRTVRRWMKDPDFTNELAEVQHEASALFALRVQHVSTLALLALEQIFMDPQQSGSTRVGAATAAITFAKGTSMPPTDDALRTLGLLH